MKRTIKEVYDLIKEKRNNAEKRYQVTKHKELGGTIDAYQDVLCLIESSHLLEDIKGGVVMSKGLKALEQLKQHYIDIWDHDFSDIDENEQYEIIEKELKALEIIKNKQVDTIELFGDMSLKEYNRNLLYNGYYNQTLTQEEYVLLKEVLL